MERENEGEKLEREREETTEKKRREVKEGEEESKEKDEEINHHHRFLASLNRLNPTNPLRIIFNGGAGGSRFTTPPPNLAQPLRSSSRVQPPPTQTPPTRAQPPVEPQPPPSPSPSPPPPPLQHQPRSLFTPTPQVISFLFCISVRKLQFFRAINPYFS